MIADAHEMAETVQVGAIVFAQTKAIFTAKEFANFLLMGGMELDEEAANDCLVGLVDRKRLREIGPGVFAAPVSD